MMTKQGWEVRRKKYGVSGIKDIEKTKQKQKETRKKQIIQHSDITKKRNNGGNLKCLSN